MTSAARAMTACAATIAFSGLQARRVDAQVQIAGGLPGISIVGLGDKAVSESRERVRAAFAALGLALPAGRIIVNLAPADLPKEGSHYDLPIALALMAEIGVLPKDALDGVGAFGELGLDGSLAPTPGALPAAMSANGWGLGFICPAACGAEAAWADGEIVAAPSLIALVNHFRGGHAIAPPLRGELIGGGVILRDVKGQEQAKRALEIAAAGAHNILMVGPPGSGKSMMAQRLPGLMPPLSPEEVLEVSMIQSVAGLVERGRLTRDRPFRAPHNSASMAALVGGGLRARPGEISLAHQGVLFLDELPEFSAQALDALRQPLATGEVMIARANHRVTYPARILLAAAMNPCRCGGGPGLGGCRRGPRCALDYQARLSGPLLDRIDIQLDVPPVTAADLALPPPAEGTAEAAARVFAARAAQAERGRAEGVDGAALNAHSPPAQIERIAAPDAPGAALLERAAEQLALSARAYHRTLRVARTIADLEGATGVARVHIAEALSLKRRWASQEASPAQQSAATG
jgi:magnesium chelatase family protein